LVFAVSLAAIGAILAILDLFTRVELALLCPPAVGLPTKFPTAEVLMRPAGDLLYEVGFTVSLLFVAYLLLCLRRYAARGEVL